LMLAQMFPLMSQALAVCHLQCSSTVFNGVSFTVTIHLECEASFHVRNVAGVNDFPCRLTPGGVLAPLDPTFNTVEPSLPVVIPIVASFTWLRQYGIWMRHVTNPRDLLQTWLWGAFARCTLSGDLHIVRVLKLAALSLLSFSLTHTHTRCVGVFMCVQSCFD